MRIQLPEYIPISWTAVFAGVMMLVQMWEGTDPIFAGLHFLYLVIWIFTFNLAGGFKRISGAYVFWYGLLTVPVGTVVKLLINDPADSNCWTPVLTMGMYTLGMVLLCGAILITRTVMRGRPSVAETLSKMRPPRYREAAMGLFVLAILLQFGFLFLPLGLYNTVHIMDQTLPLCIILGTIYVIRSSGYQKTIGTANIVPMGYAMLMALPGFSKLALFLPWAGWLLAVAYTRFRLRLPQLVLIAFIGWLTVYVLTPVSQVGRNSVTATSYTERTVEAVKLMINLKETREIYNQAGQDAFLVSHQYYSKDLNSFWSRMTTFSADDRLISYTSKGNYVGWDGVRWMFLNLIPHFLLPNKDQYRVDASGGNYYGREVGIINSSDTTTGISFSPIPEAYHIGGWIALLLFLPGLWVLFLCSLEFVCGDLRATPWGLVIALYLAHVAPESGVDGLIQFISMGNMGMIFTIVLSSFVAPLIGTVFLQETPQFEPAALRAPAV